MMKKTSAMVLLFAVVAQLGLVRQVQAVTIGDFLNGVGRAIEKTVDAGGRAIQRMQEQKEEARRKANKDIKKHQEAMEKLANDGVASDNPVYQEHANAIEELRRRLKSDEAPYELVTKGAQGLQEALTENLKESGRRQTEVAKQAEANKGALQRLAHLLKPQNIKKVAGAAITVGGGVLALYYIFKLIHKYVERQLGQPTLVRDSSLDSYEGVVSYLTSLFSEEELKKELNINDIIVRENLEKELRELALTTKTAAMKGLPYQHAMFYGEPGTGKTMFAKILAQYANAADENDAADLPKMEYAIMSGADFGQFEDGKDIEALHDLFDWAESTQGGLLVFIDECEAFLRKRALSDAHTVKLLDAFLSRTGTSSKKIMFVFATNHPELIDKAVHSRITHTIHFPLPGQNEREQIIKLYLKKYIADDRRKLLIDGKEQEVQLFIDDAINDEFISNVAQKLKGVSGRQIEQTISTMRTRTYLTHDLVLTKQLFNDVLKTAIARQKSNEIFEKATGLLDTTEGKFDSIQQLEGAAEKVHTAPAV